MREPRKAKLACLTALLLLSQLSCGISKSEIKCALVNEQTDKTVPAKYVVRGTGADTSSYSCIDYKGKGCTVQVGELADYDVFCYPLEYGYKLTGSESQNIFPGNKVTFYCTQ